MNKKYQIFISSTFTDLRHEREQVIKACLELGHIPVGMEMFSAADEEQWKIIQRQIDEIDYYVIMVAHRYGSTTKEGLSYTEKEYDYAASKGIPILGFVINSDAPWDPTRFDDKEELRTSLASFKEKVKSRMVNFWGSKDELYAKFSIALSKSIVSHPRQGWVRSEDAVSAAVTKELSRLSSENSKLRDEIALLKQVEAEEETASLKEAYNALKKNKETVYMMYQGAADWSDDTGEQSLLSIFKAIAPGLLVEGDTISIAESVALYFVPEPKKFRRPWPVPSNHLADWLVDFSALGLVEPSRKKHAVADTKEYWSLTHLGKEMIDGMRKRRLLAGDQSKKEPPKTSQETKD